MLQIMIEKKKFKKKKAYKELSFETAIRNPERYNDILTFMKDYNGVELNDDNLLKIVSNMYVDGLVTSNDFILKNYKNNNEIYNAVIKINSTRKADGGFPSGYQSRFWTYMRTLSEFGFVYARYNEIFQIGEIGKMLIQNELDSQEAFSLQAIKYNRRSPYKNVSNDFNYFKFIINVLKRLNKRNKKLSYNQFIISLFSKDGNIDEFFQVIDNNVFSDKYTTYDYIKKNYPQVNKFQTVMQDYPDVVLRMLRITGFVNVEYNGILLIDLNEEKKEYIDKLFKLDYTLTEEEKTNAKKYFKKLQKVTDYELSLVISNRGESEIILNYNDILKNIINKYEINEDMITKNIQNLCSNRKTDERFKYISDPLKFEFFIAIFMYILYGKNYKIKPNYKVDANGLPISHAPGNIGDIEILGKQIYWLLEVTLIRNKTQQLNNETVNLFRHINAQETDEKYLSLIAPYIHQDTETLYKASTISLITDGLENFFAKPYDISEFIKISKDKNNFKDMRLYTKKIFEKIVHLIKE